MDNKWHLVIVLVVSVCVHFFAYGTPNQVVFDEVHFGSFVSSYYDREYFFDIHPPLGKLMIAGFARLFDFKPEYSFAEIGDEFPDKQYLALRFLPTLAGTLFPVVIFLLLKEMGLKSISALAGGLLIALENALLVESRFILMDMFLLTFGFAALWMYLRYYRTRHLGWCIGAGVLGALALSIKWTGISFLALIGLFAMFDAMRTASLKEWSRIALFLGVLPLVIYFSIFAIHFHILSLSGPGDAFMTPEFQKTLTNNAYQTDETIHPSSLVARFVELNLEMYRSNQRLTASHPYASAWYTWPFMARPIYYWNGTDAKIYFIGNPIIWWASSVAVLSFMLFTILRQMPINRIVLFLLIGYIANMLPFVGVHRIMFLYHYLIALIFAIMMLIYLLDSHPKARTAFTILIFSAAALFTYFAPLSYGLPIGEDAVRQRFWMVQWE